MGRKCLRNPDMVDERGDLVDWDRLRTADWQRVEVHKDRSSQIRVDPQGEFLRKRKPQRGLEKRNREFWGLVTWDRALAAYNEAYGTDVHSPTPAMATGNDVVMAYLDGDIDDLGQVLSTGALQGVDNMGQVAENLGAMQRIKENERLYHGDVALRHFMVDTDDYTLYVIDFDGAGIGVDDAPIDDERATLREDVLEKLAASSPMDMLDLQVHFADGYRSVPDRQLLDDAYTVPAEGVSLLTGGY